MTRLPRLAALAVLLATLPALPAGASTAGASVGALTGAPTIAPAVAPAVAAAQEQPVEQATFGVRPATATEPDNRSRYTYGATPGAVVRDHLAVSNVGTGALTLRVYASDAFNTPEGGFDLLAAGRAPTDVGSWIRTDQDAVAVAGRSVAIVPFTLTVPPDATPGDHVGGIVASLATERVGADGAKVAVEQRVGARVYLRVSGELRPQLSVEGLTTTYHHTLNPFGRGRATVGYTVRNVGNVRLQGAQRVSVRLPWGAAVESAALPPLPELLPGNAFAVTAEVAAVFPAGWLTGRVELEPGSLPGDQNPPLPGSTASSTTSAVPWMLLGLVALVVALVLLARRRRGQRMRGGRPAGPPTGSPPLASGSATAPPANPMTPTTGSTAPAEPAGAGQSRMTLTAPSEGTRAAPVRVTPPVPVPTATRRTGRTALTLAAVATALGIGAGTPPQADAAPIGGLVVVPGESIDLAAIRVRTSGGCPAQADAYYATVHGTGFPAAGLVVTTNTAAGLSHDAGFDVYFAQTMKDFADDHQATLGGRYDVTVLCIDAFTQVSYGEFTGSLQFDTPTTYQALGTAKPSGPPPTPLPLNGGAPPLDPATIASTAPGDAMVDAATTPGSAPASGRGLMPTALIALAVAVPVAALLGYRGRRTRELRR